MLLYIIYCRLYFYSASPPGSAVSRIMGPIIVVTVVTVAEFVIGFLPTFL